ncbi:MAG: DUF962 domain-containing protein [Gammaproteobacteria bacterium]|nr:MAG: DUF962 domain-containing protein [Gammaproteobacteria bacterium]
MKKTLDDWLNAYGESHQHPVNKAIHRICVPVIYWTVFAMLWALPVPDAMMPWHFRWAWLGVIVIAIFYGQFGWRPSVVMTSYTLANILVVWLWETWMSLPLMWGAIGLFILAWIGQFWGHRIEGKKPSFFKDIQFLLIGPAWVLKGTRQK